MPLSVPLFDLVIHLSAVIFQFRILFSVPISVLFHVVNLSFYSSPVILKRSIFSSSFLRCLNLSPASSSSSSNNKIYECNLSVQYFLSLCYCCTTVKLVNMHYILKIQCVKLSHCAKFGTLILHHIRYKSTKPGQLSLSSFQGRYISSKLQLYVCHLGWGGAIW